MTIWKRGVNFKKHQKIYGKQTRKIKYAIEKCNTSIGIDKISNMPLKDINGKYTIEGLFFLRKSNNKLYNKELVKKDKELVKEIKN